MQKVGESEYGQENIIYDIIIMLGGFQVEDTRFYSIDKIQNTIFSLAVTAEMYTSKTSAKVSLCEFLIVMRAVKFHHLNG